jgi:hypothetical protein
MEQRPGDQDAEAGVGAYLWVVALCCGLAIGAAIGLVLGSIGLGIGIGLLIGVAAGFIASRRLGTDSSED